ncbi:glycosyltransferase [Pontibacter sp. SGAir0037]|uniref:glycosyltransferase family protein n=1 Tax=Pontibacter sp. SGAir0037 TaxID=2571030 RepID=UPI0010CD5699|nr:glycosyltransferase [Pontibacter sp. SGAir0037]QCR22602.1 hypothetical protein C1N53_09805 [Pontibacter sp. SGAir0037]
MKSEAIIFLCSFEEINRERKAYFEAFSKLVEVIFYDGSLNMLAKEISRLRQIDVEPILILYPNPYLTDIPDEIVEIDVPTACFHIDTYHGTKSRINESMLFDYAFVFHPGYEKIFREAGHPNAFLLPHAVEGHLYPEYKIARKYEVGWVGRLDGKLYQKRKALVNLIHKKFYTNNINLFYNQDDLIGVYTDSKIAVNISRDDYLQDANLRCFEIMAAGALLITMAPTELTALGFVDGKHFVTYQNEKDLVEKIAYYLAHEDERNSIAKAAYELVHLEHTYQNRAAYILDVLKKEKRESGAPAKSWTPKKIKEIYFEYATQQHKLDRAFRYGGNLLSMRDTRIPWIVYRLLKAVYVEFKLLF